MQRPETPVVRLGRDESTGVVDQPERKLRRPARHQCRPTPTRSSSRSAAASSPAVSAPCSRSHARIARSPRRVASHKSAASAKAAETVRPSSAACCSSASNTSAGNETERFTTDDICPWYDHGTTAASRFRIALSRSPSIAPLLLSESPLSPRAWHRRHAEVAPSGPRSTLWYQVPMDKHRSTDLESRSISVSSLSNGRSMN